MKEIILEGAGGAGQQAFFLFFLRLLLFTVPLFFLHPLIPELPAPFVSSSAPFAPFTPSASLIMISLHHVLLPLLP